jgi:hypothetical protein
LYSKEIPIPRLNQAWSEPELEALKYAAGDIFIEYGATEHVWQIGIFVARQEVPSN